MKSTRIMKVLSFAIFAQLLDMVTTLYGLSVGLIEKNKFLGQHPEFMTIVDVKLLLVALIMCLYLLTRGYKWIFNVPIAIVSVWTLAIAMVNLSQEVL